MKKVLSLVVALGVATLFSSAALAGADCNPDHKTQAAVDRTEASKDVATARRYVRRQTLARSRRLKRLRQPKPLLQQRSNRSRAYTPRVFQAGRCL